ncbi:MAG: sulfite exporter TauE/SafE family protein [Kofleriaceae bacterium]
MTVALLAGIVVTSVLGSVHCIAMCGPLVGLAGGSRSVRLAAVHSLGRLITYVAIGASAGLLGSALDLAGRLGNVQRFATIVAGVAILTWGGYALVIAVRPARVRRRSNLGGAAAAPPSTTFSAALVRIRTRREVRRAWWFGVATGLLPCGWLWAFAITAAGTGMVVRGALVMFAFWLGTVPMMVGLVGTAGPWLARLRTRMPIVTALVLVALGLGTLGLRWRDAGSGQVEAPHCHHGGS